MDWINETIIPALSATEKNGFSVIDVTPDELMAQVDFYKVGHHGSLNATPKKLLWEAFKKRGYDVLFLVDPVDEWFVKAVNDYDKRRLKSIAHGDVARVLYEDRSLLKVLGMRRTFILHASGAKLPTDLLGLICVRYGDATTAAEMRVIQSWRKLRFLSLRCS